jgi:hypothetical protein
VYQCPAALTTLLDITTAAAAAVVLPGVTHVAVKPWKDANGTYRLAGYVAPDSVDLAAAEAHCRAKLLPAMVRLHALW